MTTVLATVGWVLFGLAVLAGLLLDLIGFFGNWVILAAAAIAWIVTRYAHWSIYAMLVLLVLAILGEILEIAASGYGARRFGGSRGLVAVALIGCLAGGIIGTPWFPVFGTIAGACLGAFAGATFHELFLMRETLEKSVKSGFGAAIGKIAGMAIKLAVGMAMIGILLLCF